MTTAELHDLLSMLTSLPHETEWVEFKRNNSNPEEIGEYVSALANSAALHRKEAGYIVWGVSDEPGHPVVGTSFKPRVEKCHGQEIEAYVAQLLSPRIDFTVHEFEFDGKPVVMFCVQPASTQPIRFKGAEFIRIGSCKKPLRDFPEKERALWALFSHIPFERGQTAHGVSSEQVLSLIDYPTFFQLLKMPLPDNRTGVLEALAR